MKRWYVLQINQSLEGWVRRGLMRLGFGEGDISVPSYRMKRRVFGRDTAPLMPGYLFARFDPDGDEGWEELVRLPGVVRLLPSATNPLALPLGFVEELERGCREGRYDPMTVDAFLSTFRTGEPIAVTADGQRYEGRFSRVGRGRLEMLVGLLGRDVVVSVPVKRIQLP